VKKSGWPARWEQRGNRIMYRTTKAQREQHGWPLRLKLGYDETEAYRTYYQLMGKGIVVPRTIGDAINIYIASDKFACLKPKTQIEYRRSLKRLGAMFGDIAPGDWLPKFGYDYLEATTDSPVQANRDLATFSNVMKVCVRAGVIARNLVGEVERNRESPRDRYVSDDELAAFLTHCSPKLKLWFDLKLLTGLRQGQMRALRMSDWRDGELWVPAAKRGRNNVYGGPGLAQTVKAIVDEYHGETPRSIWLFCTRSGTQYSSSGIQSIWVRAMRKHVEAGGLAFTEHDVRAKVGSDSGSLAEAQERLAHQSASTTNRVYRRGPQRVSVLDKGHDRV